MSGPGNDPFSGSSIQNVLQHTISPKIVTDGSGGYTVKADLINVDNLYVTGDVYRNGSSINRYISILPTTTTTNSPVSIEGGSVAIGEDSGDTAHGAFTTSVGSGAGQTFQENGAVAIGNGAGSSRQESGAVAVGRGAGNINQGNSSIAIGSQSGVTSQAPNSIIINATGSVLNNTVSTTCVIKPIRQVSLGDVPVGSVQVYWNPATGELMAVAS
jgi:hypothetical protein